MTYKLDEAYFDGYSSHGGYTPSTVSSACPVSAADVQQVWTDYACVPGQEGGLCNTGTPGLFILEQYCNIGGPIAFVGYWVVDEGAKTIQFFLLDPFTAGPLIPLTTAQVTTCEDMLGGFC